MQNAFRLNRTNRGDVRADDPDALFEELVRNYHCQALGQANILFWFSIIVATVGFSLISYAIITGSPTNGVWLLFKTLPGTVIEIIAGFFFRQAREIRQRATALYDRLRIDKKHMDAMDLADSIEDAKVKSVLKAYLAAKMTDCL